ncbi:tRNA 4-thiouridine(8) synthase ThiI [Candidatus Beckwithbacteria bacterium CG10_big_fil_rev_8_21_14_0_10_34_10]|uniref:tRNA 4-thiouridine(8) synthase ThiI n=1 Tax=Candidatus Beckwithbacteria bacterium CG10_big_fil_rev_8_21_14_0_10_34_10 TaxID=1974495 RepID=A0A2H0W7W9_9BACT|nr:MAG: tRNA 4-thiouridine(8) synthase ThiI [Candidatus Beckwithbacteria bacterium CG10_big_fil_rev_8_21_14_0_10_34_10]
MKLKALALISGGLDSILAALLIQKQGIKVTGLVFKSAFFDPSSIKKTLKKYNLPLRIVNISEKHLKIVKKPEYGYGKVMNPCLDCHLLMLKEAKKLIKNPGFSFIITGEVLGQRPFSQNKNSLNLLEKKANLKGLILRPLSAQILEETIPEKKGWVNRDKLLDISGRSRQIQLKLRKKFKLTGYSTPGTACILTDPQFGKRLKNLLKYHSFASLNDILLLKFGRHFWKDSNLIVVGRNDKENKLLKKCTQKSDLLFELKSFTGPLVLVRTYQKRTLKKTLSEAKKLLCFYSRHTREKPLPEVEFRYL